MRSPVSRRLQHEQCEMLCNPPNWFFCMAAKSLKIDSLDLDLENPRIVAATDQRDAMQKIITEQKAELVTLADGWKKRRKSSTSKG